MLVDERHVLRHAVALVAREVVLRVLPVQLAHQAVARHLGDDRRRGDAVAERVALLGRGKRYVTSTKTKSKQSESESEVICI